MESRGRKLGQECDIHVAVHYLKLVPALAIVCVFQNLPRPEKTSGLSQLYPNNQDLRTGGSVAVLRGSIRQRLLEVYVVGNSGG